MKVVKNLAIVLLLAVVWTYAQDFKTVTKEYKNVESVEIDIVSGDCEITVGSGNTLKVEVKYDVNPSNCFEPSFSERGKTVKLSEKWKGGRCTGEVLWTLVVPKDAKIEFESASGDLSIEGLNGDIDVETASGDVAIKDCKADIEISVASGDIEATNLEGDIEISTASGDIDIQDCKGEIELSTASGDIDAENLEGDMELSVASGDMEIENCSGEFDLSTASGDIDAKQLMLKEASSFSAASGDVNVVLGSTPEVDIEVSVASGDATLDFGGNKIVGTIVMTADKKRGKINAPFKADKTEEIEKHDRTYIEKNYNMGDVPMIIIKTASGEATLKK